MHRSKPSRWVGLVSVGLIACGARSGLFASGDADAEVETEVAEPAVRRLDAGARSDASAPFVPEDPRLATCRDFDAAASGSSACRRTLRVTAVVPSAATCFVDTLVATGDEGTLFYECDGGAARAVFPRGTLQGVQVDGVLDLCGGSEFPYGDGCLWTSAQRIQGSLAGPLTFAYSEAPALGETGCLSACSARGSVTVE